jgi:hypothetical protein
MRRPAREDLAAQLGPPAETKNTPAGVLWHYRYAAASPDQRSGRIDVIFTLDPVTGKVRRIQGRIFDAALDLEFPDSTPAR